MTIVAIVSVIANCVQMGAMYLLWKDNRDLTRENIDLEERNGVYYMRMLGMVSEKDK